MQFWARNGKGVSKEEFFKQIRLLFQVGVNPLPETVLVPHRSLRDGLSIGNIFMEQSVELRVVYLAQTASILLCGVNQEAAHVLFLLYFASDLSLECQLSLL